jgi:hypothetical protein
MHGENNIKYTNSYCQGNSTSNVTIKENIPFKNEEWQLQGLLVSILPNSIFSYCGPTPLTTEIPLEC